MEKDKQAIKKLLEPLKKENESGDILSDITINYICEEIHDVNIHLLNKMNKAGGLYKYNHYMAIPDNIEFIIHLKVSAYSKDGEILTTELVYNRITMDEYLDRLNAKNRITMDEYLNRLNAKKC